MIPKIIHYCWLSDDELPNDVKECINSWKKYLPDYEIILWNTKNFDVNICEYTKEAFKEKKYAFVSDYVRLYALYNFGGIYLDSDIEVLKSFDDLLDNKAFTCFEDTERIAAWIFGSEKGNPLFKEFMDDYIGRRFLLETGEYDLTPNPVPITNRLKKHGLELNGSMQKLDLITIYPMTYFCPFNPYRKSGDCFSEFTYANHHFNGTWKKVKSDKEKNYQKREKKYIKIFGEKLGAKIFRNVFRINNIGFLEWIKRYIIKK